MKAIDLMIGDFVKFANSDVCHMVYAVQGKSVKIDKQYWHKADKLKPIPITPEILEKNGFVKEYGAAWNIYRHSHKKWFVLFKKEFGLYLHIGETEFRIDYVHELQHLMRLFLIESEIKL